MDGRKAEDAEIFALLISEINACNIAFTFSLGTGSDPI